MTVRVHTPTRPRVVIYSRSASPRKEAAATVRQRAACEAALLAMDFGRADLIVEQRAHGISPGAAAHCATYALVIVEDLGRLSRDPGALRQIATMLADASVILMTAHDGRVYAPPSNALTSSQSWPAP